MADIEDCTWEDDVSEARDIAEKLLMESDSYNEDIALVPVDDVLKIVQRLNAALCHSPNGPEAYHAG